MATEDPSKRREVVDAVLHLLLTVSKSERPPQIATRIHSTVRHVSGCDDPYSQVKKESNATTMELYPQAREWIAASDDPLRTAVELAAVGNIIDSGAGLRFDLKTEIQRAQTKGFTTDDFDRFRHAVSKASTILYLADNAGEIVFDRLLIEQMSGKRIFVAVKTEPILNDALLADAEFAGIHRLATLVTTGTAWPEIAGGDSCSDEFLEVFRTADVIIAKGQGNYEWLSEAKAHVFFILMAKCPVVARELGVEVGTLVVKSSRGS